MPKDDVKPEGWEALRREGDPEGLPEVGHDKRRHLNYHVRQDGSICWHGVPEGFAFREGILVAQTPDAPAQVTGTAARPASIPGVLVAEAARESGTVPEVDKAAEREG